MTERIAGRFIGFGALSLVLGPIAALFGALGLTATIEVAIATHVGLMLTGVAFVGLGVVWPRLRLDDRSQEWAFWALLLGASVVLVTGATSAFLGVGGQTLSAFGPESLGGPGAEALVRFGIAGGGLSVLVGLLVVRRGILDVPEGSDEVGSEAPFESAEKQLIQLGVLFLVVSVGSGVLAGTTAVPGLPTATAAGAAVSGLMLLGFGLVWPRVVLADPLKRVAARLLLVGAAGGLGGGLLAALGGGDLDVEALSPAGVLGSQGLDLGVKLIALLVVLVTVVGVALVWHGLPKPGPRSEGALRQPLAEWMTARFIRLGVLVVLLAALAALVTSLTRNPRVAVGTYATVLIIGPMFMCFGLLWPRVHLSEGRQKTAYSLLAIGAHGILISGMILAMLGIGGDTLRVSAAEALGTESQEMLAKILVDLSALLVAAGLLLVWLGVREPVRALHIRYIQLASFVAVALVLEGSFYHAYTNLQFGEVYPLELPTYDYEGSEYQVVKEDWIWDDATRTTAQNWTPDEWQWFYHAPQGGAFELPVPYEWMMQLEQPVVRLWPRLSAGPLMDPAYLARFGFLPDPITTYDPQNVGIELHPGLERFSRIAEYPESNKDLLPVGFVRTPDWVDHATGQTINAMGFTCAACHTGQVDYVSADTLYRIRIEGGPANVDLGRFRSAVGISLALTRLLPGRLDRFAEALGREDDKAALTEELDALLDRGLELRTFQDDRGIYPTTEGFARLDAIGRIANYVFGNDLAIEDNVQVADAPVNFPHIWDAPWFEWVQYNASFKQPMMRNAGESMGVFASVDMVGSGPGVPVAEDPLLFSSSVDVISLHEMETLIGGQRPFSGLQSPVWPDAFPPIDQDMAGRGADLYQDYCAHCHLTSPDREEDFYADQNWTAPDEYGNRYLALEVRSLWEMGTDPRTALNFARRRVDLGPLGERLGIEEETSYGEALPLLIRLVKEKRYADYRVADSPLGDALDGYREDLIQAPMGYRARPLNGIWATPPFLHNGSVPNLYQLLGPQSDRADRFYLGSRLFDADSVGFFSGETPGGFELDTSLPGNSNRGHVFEGGESTWRGRQGVVGPALTHQQRLDLIEYLKSLPPLPSRP